MNQAKKKLRLKGEESKAKRREYQRLYAANYRKTHVLPKRTEYHREYEKKRKERYSERRAELAAIRYSKNRNNHLSKNKEYHRIKKEEIAARKRAWRKANYEAIRKRELAYKRSERGRIADNASKRRRVAQKFGCPTPATVEQIHALKLRQRNCHYCKVNADEKPLTIDHFWPLAKGGSHAIENLVMACKSCNSRKSKLTPDVWAARSGYVFTFPYL